MCRVLRNIGCKCSEAYDGTECLEIVRTRMQASVTESMPSNCPSDNESVVEAPIDLILMDSEMPSKGLLLLLLFAMEDSN